mmetsp:Transcript_34857/g.62306  ORF Transcript_34857/g.62306 Transcript_34857/m.62306 type:complete len:247 (-) Transcript_34857:128-868(-)
MTAEGTTLFLPSASGKGCLVASPSGTFSNHERRASLSSSVWVLRHSLCVAMTWAPKAGYHSGLVPQWLSNANWMALVIVELLRWANSRKVTMGRNWFRNGRSIHSSPGTSRLADVKLWTNCVCIDLHWVQPGMPWTRALRMNGMTRTNPCVLHSCTTSSSASKAPSCCSHASASSKKRGFSGTGTGGPTSLPPRPEQRNWPWARAPGTGGRYTSFGRGWEAMGNGRTRGLWGAVCRPRGSEKVSCP